MSESDKTEREIPWPSVSVAVVVILLLTALVWLIAVWDIDSGNHLAAAGNAVQAIGTLAAVGAAVFAVQQLQLQRKALEDQRKASDEVYKSLLREHEYRALETLSEAYSRFAARTVGLAPALAHYAGGLFGYAEDEVKNAREMDKTIDAWRGDAYAVLILDRHAPFIIKDIIKLAMTIKREITHLLMSTLEDRRNGIPLDAEAKEILKHKISGRIAGMRKLTVPLAGLVQSHLSIMRREIHLQDRLGPTNWGDEEPLFETDEFGDPM